MDGWGFAAAGLAGILLFELLVFRYFASDRPTERSLDGTDETARSHSGAASGSYTAAAVTGTDTAGITDSHAPGAVECRRCGTRNADVSAIVFCRSCLGRLS